MENKTHPCHYTIECGAPNRLFTLHRCSKGRRTKPRCFFNTSCISFCPVAMATPIWESYKRREPKKTCGIGNAKCFTYVWGYLYSKEVATEWDREKKIFDKEKNYDKTCELERLTTPPWSVLAPVLFLWRKWIFRRVKWHLEKWAIKREDFLFVCIRKSEHFSSYSFRTNGLRPVTSAR